MINSALLLSLGISALLWASASGQDAQKNLRYPLSQDEIAEGWICLFNGQDLFGWRAESAVDWTVRDQTVGASRGERGLLRTTSQFDSFELRLEFTAGPETNSGVFIHTSPQPTDPTIDCYEINIVAPDRHEFTTGSIVGRAKAKRVVPLEVDIWHTMRIVAGDGTIAVEIDGETTCEYRDAKPLGRGFIGLQYNGGPVSFRNIRLRPLGQDNLFPVDPLESVWDLTQLLEARARVNDQGWLELTGGRGQIESRRTYDDFVMTVIARTPENVNSGIFFRCIPGEVMNGYECQIDHRADEQGRPIDCGTGGIFRRQDARRVLSKPNEWFVLTIAANGPHLATWVNGMQVTEWRDEREADPNPRRGRRLERGTIALQGHDPTTFVEFAKIQIRSLDPRQR